MPTPVDRQGLEVLDFQTCLDLIADTPVGRIAFVHAGEPVILPVNHVLDGRHVAFLTAPGAMFEAASRRAAMAFEVDSYDPDDRSGWSVVVRGIADLETDDERTARLESLGLHPWADAIERTHWVRIDADEITGRRIIGGFPQQEVPT